MTWEKLKTKDTEYIVDYINKESIKFVSLEVLADKLGTNLREIEKYLEQFGYIRKNNSSQFKKSMYADLLHSVNDPREKAIAFLIKEIDILRNMVDKYKENNQVLIMDLPEADIKRTTIKVNEKIWNDFNKFAEEINYSKQDLLSFALSEFIKNHKIKVKADSKTDIK